MKFLKKFATRAEYEAYMAYNENYPFVGYIADEGKVEYQPPVDFSSMPMYIKALEDITVSFTTNTIQYSLDNEAWVDLPVGESTPTIAAGDKVYFRAEGLSPSYGYGIGTFNISGRCHVEGNIMSLIHGDDFDNNITIKKYAFFKLFQNQPIVDASRLIVPATTMLESCYQYMFSGCSSLVKAPELPATNLASQCYYSMFLNCTSLVKAPELPATILKTSCYNYMFKGCKSLAYIKMMALDGLSSGSYTNSWVDGVGATGTFVKNAAATWEDTFGTSAIPTGWTVEMATE